MYAYDDNREVICARCGKVINSSNASKDHFIPKSFYHNELTTQSKHLTESENIVYICKDCNNSVGNTVKSPKWYKHLTSENINVLYNTVRKFLNHPGKSDIGSEAIDRYIEILNSYNKSKDSSRNVSLETILGTLIKVSPIGKNIDLGDYIITITESGYNVRYAI